MALPRWTDTDARPLLQGSADDVEHELCLPGLLDQQGHPTSFGCKFNACSKVDDAVAPQTNPNCGENCTVWCASGQTEHPCESAGSTELLCLPNVCDPNQATNRNAGAIYRDCEGLRTGQSCTPTCGVSFSPTNPASSISLVCDTDGGFDQRPRFPLLVKSTKGSQRNS